MSKRSSSRDSANFFEIKDSMQDMLKSLNLEEKYLQTLVITKWETIMGASVVSRTENIFFKEQTLVVIINSAPLKHQLNQSKSKIINLLNESVGKEVVKKVDIL